MAHPSPTRHPRPRVVIAGAGVAGLEVLLALRELTGDLLDVTVVEPELWSLRGAPPADHLFRARHGHPVRTHDILSDLGARWVRSRVDRVVPETREVVTRDADRLSYDRLVLALGAHPQHWVSRALRYRNAVRALTYGGPGDDADYAAVLQRIDDGRIGKLAFVKPRGPTWPLPLYDLALLTRAHCDAHGRPHVAVHLVTSEAAPLDVFGEHAAAAVRRLLEHAGVRLHAASDAEQRAPGWLDIAPGGRRIAVDQVVYQPRLAGPRLRGLRCDRHGFIETDAHGRVPGLCGVFAAGDATSFRVKQGGVAAQQGDAVAEAIAASVGVDIEPAPFQPVLRGVLSAGDGPRYLRAELAGGAPVHSVMSRAPLWSPPHRLVARHLAPYLRGRADAAAGTAQARQG